MSLPCSYFHFDLIIVHQFLRRYEPLNGYVSTSKRSRRCNYPRQYGLRTVLTRKALVGPKIIQIVSNAQIEIVVQP